eukprot:Opistho-1_new@50486
MVPVRLEPQQLAGRLSELDGIRRRDDRAVLHAGRVPRGPGAPVEERAAGARGRRRGHAHVDAKNGRDVVRQGRHVILPVRGGHGCRGAARKSGLRGQHAALERRERNEIHRRVQRGDRVELVARDKGVRVGKAALFRQLIPLRVLQGPHGLLVVVILRDCDGPKNEDAGDARLSRAYLAVTVEVQVVVRRCGAKFCYPRPTQRVDAVHVRSHREHHLEVLRVVRQEVFEEDRVRIHACRVRRAPSDVHDGARDVRECRRVHDLLRLALDPLEHDVLGPLLRRQVSHVVQVAEKVRRVNGALHHVQLLRPVRLRPLRDEVRKLFHDPQERSVVRHVARRHVQLQRSVHVRRLRPLKRVQIPHHPAPRPQRALQQLVGARLIIRTNEARRVSEHARAARRRVPHAPERAVDEAVVSGVVVVNRVRGRLGTAAHAAVALLEVLPQQHAPQGLVEEVGHVVCGLRNVQHKRTGDVVEELIRLEHLDGEDRVAWAAVKVACVVVAALDGAHGRVRAATEARVLVDKARLGVRHEHLRVARAPRPVRVGLVQRHSAPLMEEPARHRVPYQVSIIRADAKRVRAPTAVRDERVRSAGPEGGEVHAIDVVARGKVRHIVKSEVR